MHLSWCIVLVQMSTRLSPIIYMLILLVLTAKCTAFQAILKIHEIDYYILRPWLQNLNSCLGTALGQMHE